MSLKGLGARAGLAKKKHTPKESRRGLKLEQISDRPHGDSRPLNPQHVEELAESIAAVGLIQPLVVDNDGHLLAGGHRRAALQLLEQEQADKFAELFPGGLVPVRVFDFLAETEADQAIAIEAAENEKRRDYTPAEVRALADRLVLAGYRRKGKGRPKKGEKPLIAGLSTIIGKSARQVERYLEPNKSAHAELNEGERQKKIEAKAVKVLEELELSDLTDETTAALAAKLRERLAKPPHDRSERGAEECALSI